MKRLLPTVLLCVASFGCQPKEAKVTPPDPELAKIAPIERVATEAVATEAVAEAGKLPDEPKGDLDTDSTTATAGNSNDNPSTPTASEENKAATEATKPPPETKWTRERLVILAHGGPRVIDVQVNVAGRDLPTGFSETADVLSKELGIDWSSPVSWDSILEEPLIQSGWLGNLVPTPEQRAQMLGLYDNNGDRMLDPTEFRAFLTRGLSRNRPVRLVHVKPNEVGLRSASVWGPMDRNDDGELTADELSQVTKSLLHYDFDGDRILTRQEFQSANESTADQSNMVRYVSDLESTSVQMVDSNKFGPVAQAVFEQYTFTEAVARDALFNWTDERFGLLADPSGREVSKRDLAKLASMPADAILKVTLADGQVDQLDGSLDVELNLDSKLKWLSAESLVVTGRLTGPGLISTVALRDDHSPDVKRSFIGLLAAAEGNPQLRTQLTSQFELKNGAFDLLAKHGEKAHETAWRWLTAARGWHIAIQWSVTEKAWYELLDANADGRLALSEFDEFVALAKTLDRDADGAIQASEMPLAINLLVARLDNRGMIRSAGGSIVQKRGAIAPSAPAWFVGMDYNLDGGVTRSEFLGEDPDFERFDKNRDGIIDSMEVLAPK